MSIITHKVCDYCGRTFENTKNRFAFVHKRVEVEIQVVPAFDAHICSDCARDVIAAAAAALAKGGKDEKGN